MSMLRGRGKLHRTSPLPADWKVGYEFTVENDPAGSTGIIWSLNEQESLPEGIFEFTAEDGRFFRVKNFGLDWIILPPDA